MVGTDIIEVERIEKLIKSKGQKFLRKIYTQIEINYCESKGPNKYQHYAGRFAAKEAIFKAVGDFYSKFTHVNPPLFKGIEIKNKDNGILYVDIIPDTLKIGASVRVSISHIKKYAVAVAYIDKLKGN